MIFNRTRITKFSPPQDSTTNKVVASVVTIVTSPLPHRILPQMHFGSVPDKMAR